MNKHPNVEIFYEPTISFQTYEQKILTSIVAGSPPDVFLLDSKIIPSFIKKGVLIDLMPYVQRLGIDLNTYFPNVLRIAQRKSSLNVFPKDFTPLVISFNKKLFDQEGMPYPRSDWTWEDFLATAQRLTKDTDGDGKLDQFGAMVPNAFYYWIPFVWMNGGDVLSSDGRRASGYFNSPATEKALQFVINLQRKYKVSPYTGSHGQSERSGLINSLFFSNRIGMRIDGHWSLTRYLPFIKSGELDIGVAPLPYPKTGKKVNVMYEAGWCVPKNTSYPELAVELAAFLSDETACRIRSELGLAIPAVKSVAAEQAAKDSLGIEQVFVEEVQYCRQPWGTLVERFSELELIFQDAVDDVLINGKPIHESFTRYAIRVDAKLNQIWSLKSFKLGILKGHTEILNFLFGVCAVALAFGLYGIFMTGLQGIPEFLYEAAIIDGASPWQRFKNITLPLLKPTTFFILVTSFIGSFQVFTSIFIMTGGGPARSTDVIVFHIYQAAWDNLRMGYASAMSIVLFVIIMFATWLQFRLMGKKVEYGYF